MGNKLSIADLVLKGLLVLAFAVSAYYTSEARRHSAENNCILWAIAEKVPGPERVALVGKCREAR